MWPMRNVVKLLRYTEKLYIRS